jgi:HAD superfamily hydrolase (TIGR01509 family)
VPIRAVVFDIGGVLEIAPDGREPMTGFGELLAGWERRFGLEKARLGKVVSEMYASGARGSCSEREWWQELRTRIGVTPELSETLSSELWTLYLGELNHELAGYFSGLRPRFRTALLSNSFVGAREREEARYAFSSMTDLIVYSHEDGLLKPERRIYELTTERLGVRPEESLFVDDRVEHVEAARGVGMTALLFRGNAELLAELERLLPQ